jgi:uncharacterized protein (DUF1330 family)
MSTYAIAHMRSVNVGPPIFEYLERIDATLVPFQGRFLVHGAKVEVVEGDWPGNVIVIEFPDRKTARAWYESSAYQRILPLRTANSESDVVLVDGVPEGYRATDTLAKIRGG